jgi:hypothetical protein
VILEIQSIGPPPEQHADRIVAAMLRDLAKKRAQVELAVLAAIENSKDGNPKAQAKMAERIRQAGAEYVSLQPGKRGKYTIMIQQMIGWDPIRDQEIRVESPIPAKPWVACHIAIIEAKGRGRTPDGGGAPVLLITHHALSRAAQRFEVRTNEHMLSATRWIWNATQKLILENARDWTPPPPQGLRVPLGTADNAVVVLKQHENRERTLVAATIFSSDNPEHSSE